MRRSIAFLLFGAMSLHPAPRLSFATNAGANMSFYKADMPDFLSVEERSVSFHPLFGTSLELELHEFLRLSLGAMLENREGILKGNVNLGILGTLDGDYDYVLFYI